MTRKPYSIHTSRQIQDTAGQAGPGSDSTLKVICMETEAFYRLIEEVVARIDQQRNHIPDRWISDREAMRILRISSTTTLQKYRDQGMIRYSQPSRKIILYDRESVLEFIEDNVRETF